MTDNIKPEAWAEARKFADSVLDARTTIDSVNARLLAQWVQDNAPQPPKPTIRRQILDLPHGTIFSLKEPDQREPWTFVIQRDEAVRLNGDSPGNHTNLMRNQPDDKSAFSAWHPDTVLKVIVTL